MQTPAQVWDYWYDKWRGSTVSRACIVRLTNRCDQQCEHCAFASGPGCHGQMSVETCEQINRWIPKSVLPNIMGGEFTILPNYPDLLLALARYRDHIHMVTNGIWGHSHAMTIRFLDTIRQIKQVCPKINVAVSTDNWHVVSGQEALDALDRIRKTIKLIPTEPVVNITPVGRAWLNGLGQKRLSCASCEVMSNMIIREDGMICRCPYAYFPWKHFSETTWDEAQEYVWGWRSEKLSEGMNCHLCMESVYAGQRGKHMRMVT